MLWNREKAQKAVGKCPHCNQYPTWFNNVPLTAYFEVQKKYHMRNGKKLYPNLFNLTPKHHFATITAITP